MVDNRVNCCDNSKKQERLNQRLLAYIKEDFDVLDVGAGEAWAMDYFMVKKCNYFAIEAVDKLSESIEARGGKVIGKTVFDNYLDYKASFDIIIFRHVLEHLLNPKAALKNLKNMLKEDGMIYLVVPNAADPGIKKGFLSSFIRPVHISYFCEGNIQYLANLVGLNVLHSEVKGEIYCLLEHGDGFVDEKNNYYLEQKQTFLKRKKEAFVIDTVNIFMDILRVVVKKMVK